MPSTSAARRASPASSIEQQPREPVRNWSRLRESAMWTPTTSCPASTARAAATAESTPPERAARTRTGPGYVAAAGVPRRPPGRRSVAVLVAEARFDLPLQVDWPVLVASVVLVTVTATSVGYAVAVVLTPLLAQVVSQVLVFFVLLFSPVTFSASQLPAWFG